jgi:outer membrane protein OmpA-like peptidoglycan-associated protein
LKQLFNFNILNMKKILTILFCLSLLCTGCGSSSKASKSAIMGDGSAVGAGIDSPGGKDTKKKSSSKSSKETKKTKKTTTSKETERTTYDEPVGEDAVSIIGYIMEQKASDMSGIGDVSVETITDSRGYEAIKVTFDSGILFETGKYSLNEDAKEALSAFVEEMRELPETNITVYGHTDNTGSAAVNERVSLQRAKSVSDYLKRLGIEAHRIVHEGKSFREPIADNSTAEGRRINRRVEVFVYANDSMIRQAREGSL